METLTVDICVIGAGSGGLSVAAGASQMGASTALVEKGMMGGDCLNYGCVPSKALLAAGHIAASPRYADRFGVDLGTAVVDGRKVYEHVHGVIGAIAPNDSVERFEGLGVRVVKASARFISPELIEADGLRISARRFVIATGSSPMVQPIDGLVEVPYLTNETVFDLTTRPAHLIIVGGGPIGIEMAQAHRQLGSRVTVLEMANIMPKDDPELVDVVRHRLTAEGVEIREGVKVEGIKQRTDDIIVSVTDKGQHREVDGSHLLIAAGRSANVDGLDLERAGIAYTRRGIEVDARLRTTNRKVYALGDVIGGYQFTHVAGYHAGVVIKNALFRLPVKADHRAVPWVTYTQPELAQVGLTEAQAEDLHRNIRVLRWPFHDNDRAQAEHKVDGLVKVITTNGGRILGAGIAGPAAGELIYPWVLAIQNKLKIGAIATMIAPYPTLGEVNKRAAGTFYTPSLFSDRTQKIVRFLARFG